MEAKAAFGIAGNIVQFLDFSQKLCRTFSQIYQSATGATKDNTDTKTLVNSFASGLNAISADLAKYCAYLSTDITTDRSIGHADGQMQTVIQSCREVAADLLGRLERVKLGSKQTGKRKAILVAVKAIWRETELLGLEQKLTRFRKELQWTVIVSLR